MAILGLVPLLAHVGDPPEPLAEWQILEVQLQRPLNLACVAHEPGLVDLDAREAKLLFGVFHRDADVVLPLQHGTVSPPGVDVLAIASQG